MTNETTNGKPLSTTPANSDTGTNSNGGSQTNQVEAKSTSPLSQIQTAKTLMRLEFAEKQAQPQAPKAPETDDSKGE